MKKVSRIFICLGIIFSVMSCSKDPVFENGDMEEATVMYTKAGDNEVKRLGFSDGVLYASTEIEGKSSLLVYSDGKMSDEFFSLCIYFEDVYSQKVGGKLVPSYFNFCFPFSSDSRNYTRDFTGSVILVGRNDKEAVVRFNELSCSVAFGDYCFDGCLTVPIVKELR